MAAAQTNGLNPERTKECVDRIENIAAKKAAAHMAYMKECSVFAEETKEIYTEAKTAWGIPTRALKAVIKTRVMEQKLEALRDGLEEDQESFDQIRHALGDLADLPLGEVVTAKASGKKSKSGSSDALDAVAGNGAERLATGISPLN